MEPPGGHGVSSRPDPRVRWPEHRAYLPLSPGPPRVCQENFEIHMHETPVGPSREPCSFVRPTGGVPEQYGMVYLLMEGPARAAGDLSSVASLLCK